jgi:anti-sigma B factor antagonist
VDLTTAADLQQRLEGQLSDGAQSVVVDMSDVSYCDVTGLNVLLRVQAQLPMPAARLTVLCPCRSLEIMVAALGLEHRLQLVPCRVAAGPAADRA